VVIVPDFTFAATASSVRHAAATPVLVDVSEETWTLDLAATERAITPKTRAIIPVHLYGHPCEMAPLMALAQAHGLFVIEDVAEAFGAYANGQLVGTFGDAACFSFYGNKTLTTGEGGMLLTRDAAVAERAALLRDHGMSKERRYWHVEVGFNYRLTNLQAAVGVAQMERVDDVLARKQALAARYGEALAQIAGLELPPSAPWAAPVCWLYTVRVLETLGLARDDLAARLLQRGIETRPTFLPLHRMPAFAEFTGERNFPVTDMLAASGLSLPSAATLDERDVDAVVDAIQGIAEVRRLRVSAGPSST
jgi:perosamine synthetase